MILVIAGNYRQYRQYIEQGDRDPRDFRFLENENSVMGCTFDRVIRVGTWWENPIAEKEYLWVPCLRADSE